MTVVIGLTGGIASGKSTVSSILAEHGAAIINADEIGHQVLVPHSQLWQEVLSAFGKGIFLSNEEVNRQKLGEIVFNNPEALKRLNQIMHPPMHRIVERKIENLKKQGSGVIVLEAAVLLEAGWEPLVDEIWVTAAPETTVVQRLRNGKNFTESQALDRIYSQLPSEERMKRADVIINTDCDLSEVRARVEELWKKLQGD